MNQENISSTIGLVLDPNFGSRILTLAEEMPLWVISSSKNDRSIDEARAVCQREHITKIVTRPDESQDALLSRAMCAIDDHHGEASQPLSYKTLLIYGGSAQPSTELLTDLGFTTCSLTPEGFKAAK